MDDIKKENFALEHPNLPFPDYRTLNASESGEVRQLLVKRMAVPLNTSPLDLVNTVVHKSKVLAGVNAEDDTFDVNEIIKTLQINPKARVFINWYRYDRIDEMRWDDISMYFDDLWYPAADDIDIFDETLGWILSIGYSGEVRFLKL